MQLKSSTSIESCPPTGVSFYTITGARNVVKLGQGTGAKGNQLIMIIERPASCCVLVIFSFCSLISWWHITEAQSNIRAHADDIRAEMKEPLVVVGVQAVPPLAIRRFILPQTEKTESSSCLL